MTEPRLYSHVWKAGLELQMIKWALVFLVVGLIAGALGFTGIAGASVGIAKVLFFIGLAIFAIMLLLGVTVFKKIT